MRRCRRGGGQISSYFAYTALVVSSQQGKNSNRAEGKIHSKKTRGTGILCHEFL